MTYKRAELDRYYIINPWEHQEEIQKINEELLNRFESKGSFTLAEEEQLGRIMSIIRNEEGKRVYAVDTLDECKNYWFRDRYLTYVNDLNGYKKVVDAYGEIDLGQKKKDVAFLEAEYQAWNTLIAQAPSVPTADRLFNYLVSETKEQLRELNKYCARTATYGFRKDYLQKSIVLHGKFILLLVREYYQEFGALRETVDLFGHNILIDGYFYIHTLFRHYSEFLKEHQGSGKSYHQDRQIHYRDLPAFSKKIVEAFRDNLNIQNFDKGKADRTIDFIYNGSMYSLWFKAYTEYQPGNVVVNFFRAQTLYPIELSRDLARISGMTKKKVDEALTFFI